MSLFDNLSAAVANLLAGTLGEQQKARACALMMARASRPDTDVVDQVMLAHYVLTGHSTGYDEAPDDPYPYVSGDVTVLGPQIFASTSEPAENTVLNWQGENFVPQRFAPLTGEPDEEHEDDPGPEEPLEFDPEEPAPMAGAHWQGRRGSRSG